jgi:hypothetical protein
MVTIKKFKKIIELIRMQISQRNHTVNSCGGARNRKVSVLKSPKDYLNV